MTDNVDALLDMIRPSQNSTYGDYQANVAMPLRAKLNRDPLEIAQEIVDAVDLDDMCQSVKVEGKGFINLKLKNEWVVEQLQKAVTDPRLNVDSVQDPKTVVIDFSSPNVAKPMHVGHIRSTVIGDSLARVLRFLGHKVITDNHLGDWGTQFGMIIYGYKHFLDEQRFNEAPIHELTRLYRLVRKLVDYHNHVKTIEGDQQAISELETKIQAMESAEPTGDKSKDKKARKQLGKGQAKLKELKEAFEKKREKIEAVQADGELTSLAAQHSKIGQMVLGETVKLHQGDDENNRLWKMILPLCHEEIQAIYDRLNIEFDHALGESFYHPMLGGIVETLKDKGLAKESDGAICVFPEGFDAPMIIQKKDGAFLYSTTDLATIKYRMETWNPDIVLYVVDFRQSEHFEKLFAVAEEWGYKGLDLKHIQFGTIKDEFGKPFQTRDGDTVGLEGLINRSVQNSFEIVSKIDDSKPKGPELDLETRQSIAETVGVGSLKYFDLSFNRSSDYEFSYQRMLDLKGDTAVAMLYSYARVNGIFRKSGVEVEELRKSGAKILLDSEHERALALAILRFEEALNDVMVDYRPNQLTSYLYSTLSKNYAKFFAECPVNKAETEELKKSRLLLCDLAARTIKQGMDLLGIQVLERM